MQLAESEGIVASGESETVEFKKSTAQLARCGETLSAFLNGQGGRVFIGITNVFYRRGLVGQWGRGTNRIVPALKAGLVAMTLPDKPHSRLQKYRLTDKGRGWMLTRTQG